MKFLANENFPGPSLSLLRENKIDIISIAEDHPGISDHEVMRIAIEEKRVILTHDSDYGELIFKYGFKPEKGIIYFRLFDFEPKDPAKILLTLIDQKLSFANRLSVIDKQSIRQRIY